MGQADWADVHIRPVSIGISAVAEGLRLCLELYMGLYANDCLKLGLQSRHELVITSEKANLGSMDCASVLMPVQLASLSTNGPLSCHEELDCVAPWHWQTLGASLLHLQQPVF